MLTAAASEFENELHLRRKLDDAFMRASENVDLAKPYFERLEGLSYELEGTEPQLLESAMATGQTPTGLFLGHAADEYLDKQIAFDQELVGTLDAKPFRANPALVRYFDGMFSLRAQVARRGLFLKGGKEAQKLYALMDVLGMFSLELSPFDPSSGKSVGDFAYRRRGETIDLLRGYVRRWTREGSPGGRLYAVVDTCAPDTNVLGAWTLWKWLTTQDLDDLKMTGRVLERSEGLWLVPVGSSGTSFRSEKDLRDAGAGQIVVAYDPGGGQKEQLVR